MPGADWLEAIEKVHKLCPEMPIIIISAVFEREILQKTYDLGVSGYVSKAFPNNLIIGAINLVLAGGIYIPPEILQMNAKSAYEPVRELVKYLSEPVDKKTEYNIT
jgi:DNA-binding NarL/FixJ family response regulator